MNDQDERYKVMLEDASMKLKAENDKLRAEVEALKDDKAMLIGQLQQSRKHVSDSDLQIDKIRNVNHDLADLVRCLEWTDPEGEIPSHCPWCEVQKPKHSNPCKLKLLIDQGYIPNKWKEGEQR